MFYLDFFRFFHANGANRLYVILLGIILNFLREDLVFIHISTREHLDKVHLYLLVKDIKVVPGIIEFPFFFVY